MPRYRLTQTAEAAASGQHRTTADPIVWDVDLRDDITAEQYARSFLGAASHRCREGWTDWTGAKSLDWYDAPAIIQEYDPSKARHIATLERLT